MDPLWDAAEQGITPYLLSKLQQQKICRGDGVMNSYPNPAKKQGLTR